ncbi:toprim domain-containing protein [Humidesulfovibrio idahonensis]
MDSNSGRQVFPSSYGSQPSNRPHPLFGLERLEPDASVILVQPPLAALRLETLGFKNVVGTTTSGNLDLTDLEAFPCVYLAFDDSEQGSALTRRAFRLLKRPQSVLLRWYVARNSAGQHLHGPLDLENLTQFRIIFDERIALMKS